MRVAFVPARGGSKSIPNKNLAMLGNRTLLEYALDAATRADAFSRIVVSTDDESISDMARKHDAEVDERAPHLARDDSPVVDAVVAFALANRFDWLYLFQPTSPFVAPRHIRAVESQEASDWASVQTVAPVPHNFHAWNQRVMDEDGVLRFWFESERQGAFNKQLKPRTYRFGNVLAVRRDSLLAQRSLWASPSTGIPINPLYALDVDSNEDLLEANHLLSSGQLDLYS